MKKCPACAEEVQDKAVKCKHCGKSFKKSNWVWWVLGIFIFFYAVGKYADSPYNHNTLSSAPAPNLNSSVLKTITAQTFKEKYPNVYAFAKDVEKWNKGIPSERVERFSKGTNGFKCAQLADGGKGTNFAMCSSKFISEHIADPSCEAAERYLSCLNYLGPSTNLIDNSATESQSILNTNYQGSVIQDGMSEIYKREGVQNLNAKSFYTLWGTKVMKKLAGGYLLITGGPQGVAMNTEDNPMNPVFLYTDRDLPEDYVFAFTESAKYVGEYEYQSINGFTKKIHAFKLFDK